jgi:hypothetical protein
VKHFVKHAVGNGGGTQQNLSQYVRVFGKVETR